MTSPTVAPPDGLTAHVASEIRAMMGRLNVNRAELARRLGVEDSWVGKRLNGRTEIGLTDFDRIAQALDVPIVDLLPRSARGGLANVSVGSRGPDVTLPGHIAWPTHPAVAAMVPLQRRPLEHGPPGRGQKTYLTTADDRRSTLM